jgi:predicted PurR-regulated permease PerM
MPTPSMLRWKAALLFVLLTAGLILGYLLREIVTPVLLAFALAYLLSPVVSALERIGINRSAAILLLYAGLVLSAGSLVVLLGPRLTAEVRRFTQMTLFGEPYADLNHNGIHDPGEPLVDYNGNGVRDRSYVERAVGVARRALKDWNRRHPGMALSLEDLLQKAREAAEANVHSIASGAGRAAEGIFRMIASGVRGLLVIFSFLLLVPMYLFIFLKHFSRFRPAVLSACPAVERDRLDRVLRRLNAAIAGFFRGQVICGSVKGALVTVGLLVAGAPYPLLLGFLYGALSMIPYLGVLLMFPVILTVTAIDAGGLDLARLGGAAAAVGFAELVEAVVLVPWIFGRETGLHPLVLLIGLFVFGQVFGVFGLLASVPLTAAAWILFQEYIVPVVREVANAPALSGAGPAGSAAPVDAPPSTEPGAARQTP